MNRDPRFKKLRSAQKNVGDPLEGHPIDGKPALQSPESSLMKSSRDMSPTSLSLLEYNGVEPEIEAEDPRGPPGEDYLETEPHHRMPSGVRSGRRESFEL